MAGADQPVLAILPELEQPSHRQRCAVRAMDAERLLGHPSGVPLVVAVGRQQTASFRPGAPERGLLGSGLDPGIDHPVADLRVLRPRRDEAPLRDPQTAAARHRRSPGRRPCRPACSARRCSPRGGSRREAGPPRILDQEARPWLPHICHTWVHLSTGGLAGSHRRARALLPRDVRHRYNRWTTAQPLDNHGRPCSLTDAPGTPTHVPNSNACAAPHPINSANCPSSNPANQSTSGTALGIGHNGDHHTTGVRQHVERHRDILD